ncbi:hypothetical protein CC77DRAFT_1080363 [Alternaria alternata]|uniref:BTB domain-containing protein n=1 Tax=Alternaria alternata TaxID=5599 RepID=A0A177D7S4_ALTAL|nr:hypothetical protein CC77DRAFT_1080363 [Alternaria alternata]OAG15152.1 hypothetical protein CC77DRAFT_1080363 [Alternaria alternata]
MPPSPRTSTEDLQPLIWLLQSFTFGKDQKTTGPADLFLDRANAEFGFIRYSAHNVAAILRFPDTDEPMYFQAEGVPAAAWREKCKKVCDLFQHLQLDLEFASPDLDRSFLDMLGDIMLAAGNQFYTYEVPPKVAFMKADFDMEQQGFISRATQPWIAVQNESSEWPRLRKTGEWSDFTIFAGGSQFPVHRVNICKESNYFKVVCSGRFRETAQQSVILPESARIVSTLLDEMYGVYNPTTGSILTNFAPCKEIEKEHMLNRLLDLFIAADKYNLEAIKRKSAEAIIDRLAFVNDALMIVDLATFIYYERCPENDRGLRKAIITCSAWKEFSENKDVLRAFHSQMCEMDGGDSSNGNVVRIGAGMTTPPASPNTIAER